MKKIFTFAIIAVLLIGCKTVTKVVPVTEIKTETKTTIDYSHDTLIIHDSVWVKEKNDTIMIDRWHTRDRIVYTNKVDSFIRVDSIPVIHEVEIPVHYRSDLDWACIIFTATILLIIFITIAWKIFKKFYLHM